ncbi:hypothetical protein B0J13DRAFT_631272 [Dactylonectria estremocensis]|uniref:C2H2-type domain-containing protein n=1 Tax=Dactylonectria estremocensis TaxID=1079267 RepID=A0A9P9D5J9_9HYPO|nr:hypothetical protein B0J13DRAFT_631272 [Dactylonectria estremocensis]
MSSSADTIGIMNRPAGATWYIRALHKESSRPQRPAQKRLMEALTAPLGDTFKDQFRRRDNAINAVSAYCVVEEGPTVRRPNTSSAYPSGRAAIGEPPAESPLHVALMSVFVKTKQERPRRCFICVSKALTLAGDDGAVQDLIHEFYTSGDLTKHLRRKHLSNLQDGYKIQCHVCDMSLDHKMHLKNHALRVHGTVP